VTQAPVGERSCHAGLRVGSLHRLIYNDLSAHDGRPRQMRRSRKSGRFWWSISSPPWRGMSAAGSQARSSPARQALSEEIRKQRSAKPVWIDTVGRYSLWNRILLD